MQERLVTAAAYLIRIRPEDMPDEELCRAFTGILDDLTFDEAKREKARLLATLRSTSSEDASSIEARILDLHLRLREQLNRQTGWRSLSSRPSGR